MNVNITGIYDNTVIVDSNLFDDVKLLQTGLSSLSDTLFNVVVPDTFNDDHNVDEPETNKLLKLVLLDKLVVILFKSEMFELLVILYAS